MATRTFSQSICHVQPGLIRMPVSQRPLDNFVGPDTRPNTVRRLTL